MALQAAGDCFGVDSVLLKACSAVPVLGHIVQTYVECTISCHLQESVRRERQIELIEVVIDYYWIAIGRDLVTVALVVAGAVAGLFSVPGALVFGGIMSVRVLNSFKRLCSNLVYVHDLSLSTNDK